MRILHCIMTHEFSGTERYVTELAAMQARHHDVCIHVARRTDDPLTGSDIAPHIAAPVRMIRAGYGGYCVSYLKTLGSFRPDVVHTHLGKSTFRLGLLPRPRRVPLVATLHSRFRKRAYNRCDALICIARWQEAEIPPSFRGARTVIGNWTHTRPRPTPAERQRMRAQFGIGDSTFLIGAGGRMIPKKGFDILLRAFQQAALPDARLILFGDGPERARLEAMGGGHVIFPGFRTDFPSDLYMLDGFVMPSLHEAFGLALLEAMSADLPVIATAAGGVLDILDPSSPSLVPPGDVAAMTQALRHMHTQQGPGHWDMQRFNPEHQAQLIEAFYNRLRAGAYA
ncbi:glycosyltransferase [Novacetimonas hansenii]|uniref:glycosyltransferase n=1 Tax=Novacetimonas hansenii TaxID=436 RepID=UPI00177D736A|nr:glycosyltransferase [Novacetimonas hansenii]MBL7236267.1 glycosyltransferase [Novacetimonas hansenii]QOF96041.1 glycosyltransferase [Novacetimonas hansenii]